MTPELMGLGAAVAGVVAAAAGSAYPNARVSAAESYEAERARKLADAEHLERLACDEWPAEAAVSRAWRPR